MSQREAVGRDAELAVPPPPGTEDHGRGPSLLHTLSPPPKTASSGSSRRLAWERTRAREPPLAGDPRLTQVHSPSNARNLPQRPCSARTAGHSSPRSTAPAVPKMCDVLSEHTALLSPAPDRHRGRRRCLAHGNPMPPAVSPLLDRGLTCAIRSSHRVINENPHPQPHDPCFTTARARDRDGLDLPSYCGCQVPGSGVATS